MIIPALHDYTGIQTYNFAQMHGILVDSLKLTQLDQKYHVDAIHHFQPRVPTMMLSGLPNCSVLCFLAIAHFSMLEIWYSNNPILVI